MCLTCGCGDPLHRHPGAKSIIWADLQAAAVDAHIDPDKAAANLVAGVKHMDKTLTGTVVKADDENRFLLLVAYSPNRMPHRGADRHIDVVSAPALEKACWRFMDNGHQAGLWHEAGHKHSARVVENYVYRGPDWVLKSPAGTEEVIKAGDWLVGFILDPPTWGMYKSGLIAGASPQGDCHRIPARPETLAQLRS